MGLMIGLPMAHHAPPKLVHKSSLGMGTANCRMVECESKPTSINRDYEFSLGGNENDHSVTKYHSRLLLANAVHLRLLLLTITKCHYITIAAM